MIAHEKYQHINLAHVKEMNRLKDEGYPNKYIANALNTNHRTVAKYLRHYQRYGDSLFSFCPQEVGKCPQCGSTNVKASVCGTGFLCRNCGNRWGSDEE